MLPLIDHDVIHGISSSRDWGLEQLQQLFTNLTWLEIFVNTILSNKKVSIFFIIDNIPVLVAGPALKMVACWRASVMMERPTSFTLQIRRLFASIADLIDIHVWQFLGLKNGS